MRSDLLQGERVRLGILGVALLAGLAGVAYGQSPRGDPAVLYEVHVTRNVMVPMRDGVRLATDVYRPALNGEPVTGRFPVVLFRIPYNKARPGTAAEGKFYARHGYVYVAQDARGRYASDGVYNPFSAELAPDGHDAVVWAANQPWSNGKVATLGGSYGGLTQLTIGVTRPPGLAAQAISWMWDNAFKTGLYVGGAFHMRRIGWIVGQAAVSQEAARDPMKRQALEKMRDDLRLWVDRFPQAFRRGASPLALVPNYQEFLAAGIENNWYGPYWHRAGLNTEEHWDEYADVPVYWMGGWYDIYTLRTPLQYRAMSRLKERPQKLIMGPWCHCPKNLSYVGDVEFGLDAAIDENSVRLRWFDQILKGEDTGILDEPPVLIFVMGGGDGHRTPEGRIYHGGEWRFENEWPPARARNTQFYFQKDETLSTEPPGTSSPTVYIHDPANPVPTVGGPDSYWTRGAALEQRGPDGLPLRLRPDVNVFQTSPLEEDVEVTGPITVKLYASSSAVNTDFTAKLIDVYPPSPDWPEGFEMNFHDGVIRASFRESLTDPRPLEPGRIYEFTIEIPPTSNVFQRGHRIRVDIASSNYPRFDINPGTMDHPWERRRYLKAENRIYHDREHPSHVVLPVIPR